MNKPTREDDPVTQHLNRAIASISRALDEAQVPSLKTSIFELRQATFAVVALAQKWDGLVQSGAVVLPEREPTSEELHRLLLLAEMDGNEEEQTRILRLLAARGKAAMERGKGLQ